MVCLKMRCKNVSAYVWNAIKTKIIIVTFKLKLNLANLKIRYVKMLVFIMQCHHNQNNCYFYMFIY